jgi:1,4-dihydroxy-2-naphthoate octaprenyltransferase
LNTIRKFLDYVEIRTKIASLTPFLTGITYLFYNKIPINVGHTLMFFAAMLLFDMSVTMINNYIDTRQSGGTGVFNWSVMLALILIFVTIAGAIGIYLSLLYGLAFFFIGFLCFVVGICYTFGPMPISRSTYGELFSGVTEGFMMPLLLLLINMDTIMAITFKSGSLNIQLDVAVFTGLVLVFTPIVVSIANIMLANNTCDREADRFTRYTLPHHIGLKNSLRLFTLLYAVAYLAIITGVIVKILPFTCLLTLATLPPVYKNIKVFNNKQVKAETFVVAIKNFILITGSYIISILLGRIF